MQLLLLSFFINQKESNKISQRLEELNTILQSMYEDKVFHKISEERYTAISANFEKEETELKQRYNEITTKQICKRIC